MRRSFKRWSLVLPVTLGLWLGLTHRPGQQRPTAPVQQPTDHIQRFDVAVIGATPEGVTAAVAAARSGKNVLLVEPSGRIGGTMVAAGLNTVDMNRGPDGRALNGGLFEHWYAQVEGDSFDVATAERAFQRMITDEPRITLWLGSTVAAPRVENRQLLTIDVRRDGALHRVGAGTFIDATEDADVAATAGVPFRIGREDYTGSAVGQAATLVFRLRAVDWTQATTYLRSDGDPGSDASSRSLWGYSQIMAGYRPVHPRAGVRGLNVGKQNDGSVLINALWVFGVDPLREASKQEGMQVALQEIPSLVAYMRAHCPGFEQAVWEGVAERLYIRESRHLADAYYTLTIDDVLDNRDQPDAVAYGAYPVDIQASEPGEAVTIIGVPQRYAVPLRSLISRSLDNLIVASRSAGYSSLAHGSARTIPVGMAVGEAAGTAAAEAASLGTPVSQLLVEAESVRAVQGRLMAQGVRIAPFQESSPLDGHPFGEDVRFFRRHGLVTAGYANHYELSRVVTGRELAHFIDLVATRMHRAVSTTPTPSDSTLSVADAVSIIARAGGGSTAVPLGMERKAPLTRAMMYRAVRSLWFGD